MRRHDPAASVCAAGESRTDDGVVDVHSLRHTCASRLARAGVPISFTQKLLGHSTIELTSRFYAHTGLEEMRAALGQLDGGGGTYELRVV